MRNFNVSMNGLFLILLFSLLFAPVSVFGITDIENKTIVADSEDSDIVLTLEFGQNEYTNFGRVIPVLESGLLTIGDSIVEIKESRTKIMGNSFVIHSENILIYAKGLENESFLINSYLIGGTQLEPIRLVSISQDEPIEEIKEKSISPEMIVLVRQDIRTFWNDVYDLEIKVFDKAINPKPQFHQSLGAIDKADINIILKNKFDEQITQFSGTTDSRGYWDGNYFVRQNLVPGGTYVVEVSVNYLDSVNFQKFDTFFISDTRASDSSD